MHLPLTHRFARLGVIVAAVVLPIAAPLSQIAPADAATLDRTTTRYVLPFAVLQGKPSMEPGDGLGYWLWHDEDGLHLRTTTHGREHDFNGVLRTGEQSRFVDVNGIKLDDHGPNQDRMQVIDEGEAIRFHFDTWDGTDGIDVRLDGRTFCIELEDNGRTVAGQVHLGASQVSPSQLPVCFQRAGEASGGSQ